MVMAPDGARDRYRQFARLLRYPAPGLGDAARACAAALAMEDREAAALVTSFASVVDRTPAGRLEEVYSGLFDLDASAPPYVGYHLFGESYKRSAFMLHLRAACRAAGVAVGAEIPDHLTVVLELLAATADDELRAELASDALAPALERMVRRTDAPAETLDAAGSPDDDTQAPGRLTERQAYLGLLRALGLAIASPVAGGESR
jgi:nitrate reductase delta subunit